MENVPLYLSLIFGSTVLFAVFLFYQATARSKTFLFIVPGWILLQSVIGLTGFYANTQGTPPGFLFLVLPPIVMIIVLFATAKGRAFIDGLDIKTLTLFHIIRIPVELVLLGLYLYKAVPKIMTFEGSNFDILSGITAHIVWYIVFARKQPGKTLLLVWNFICLALLVNIVYHAILSVPTSFQQFGFEQPNIAILHFPFVLLPACLVPMVLFAHLISIRRQIVQSKLHVPEYKSQITNAG